MKYKKISNKYIVRLEKDEEIVETLKKICIKEKINFGTIQGIGAVNRVIIGLFVSQEKKYYSKVFLGDFEICPLVGNITTLNNDVYLHLHVNICDKNHKSFGGHLTFGIVSATLELIIEKIDAKIEREFSKDIGLNLLKI